MTFYEWIYKTFKPIVSALYRIEAHGTENIPRGACILASNHTGFADVLVISAASDRQVRYMAKKAVALMERGLHIEEIKKELEVCVESSMSFVIPEDFEFLKRSGRLTALTAKVGGMLKLLPVLTQTEDKTRIKPVTVKRTWRAAVDVVIEQMTSRGVNGEYLISVCHTGTHCRAQAVLKQLQAVFPLAKFEVLTLSPALITHGGPGCIVVQAVKL